MVTKLINTAHLAHLADPTHASGDVVDRAVDHARCEAAYHLVEAMRPTPEDHQPLLARIVGKVRHVLEMLGGPEAADRWAALLPTLAEPIPRTPEEQAEIDTFMAKLRALPVGRPLTEKERARIDEAKANPRPGLSTERMLAMVKARKRVSSTLRAGGYEAEADALDKSADDATLAAVFLWVSRSDASPGRSRAMRALSAFVVGTSAFDTRDPDPKDKP